MPGKTNRRREGQTGVMATLYRVRRLKIGRSEQMDALALAAGDLYSQVVVWFWRTVRHKDLWLKAKHMMRWLTSTLLHAHTSDAIVQAFFVPCTNRPVTLSPPSTRAGCRP